MEDELLEDAHISLHPIRFRLLELLEELFYEIYVTLFITQSVKPYKTT
jgi:hypothetical protein